MQKGSQQTNYCVNKHATQDVFSFSTTDEDIPRTVEQVEEAMDALKVCVDFVCGCVAPQKHRRRISAP